MKALVKKCGIDIKNPISTTNKSNLDMRHQRAIGLKNLDKDDEYINGIVCNLTSITA